MTHGMHTFRSDRVGAMRVWPASLLLLALAIPALARMYEEPKSFGAKADALDRVQRKVLSKVPTERLLAEDRALDEQGRRPGPMRFAVPVTVAFTLGNSGTWQTLDDGRLWRLRIQSPDAKSQNLAVTRFEMPEGAKLWIYDPAHAHVEGPYTARHRSRQGSLWTPIIEGDEIVVEVFVPTGVARPTVEIGRVNQAYRGFEKAGLGGTEGACENDVVCPAGASWADQIRAVGVYTISGTSICSGTLLNNTRQDHDPLFLSANHCGVNAGNAATVVVFWNFQSPTCGTHGPGSTADNQTGATFLASSAPSDFQLIRLSAQPDPAFNVFYAGWDASGTIPTSTVGIHHPMGDVKAISFSNAAADTTAYYSATHDPNGNHWRVLWSSGVTEPGSSGSCLFDTINKRCIGQLHGGPSACGGADLHDYYGRLSVSFAGGGTSGTRLSDWLDPLGTGTLGLDGDPHVTTADGTRYDFQGAGEFVSLRNPSGLEIQVRQAPIATTLTPAADPYDGLATCVSLNTAVAARVGKHRVTYQPDPSGKPDPNGLQLRVDGVVATVGPTGLDLGDGGRVEAMSATPGALRIGFPDGTALFVTPGWWASQSVWYLNVDVARAAVTDGLSSGATAPGGLAAALAPGSWLPALPDGSTVGPMPASLHDRYDHLYRRFGDAWRVTPQGSLFDYAPGTSTDTFTKRDWPMATPPCVVPDAKPVAPASRVAAARACRPIADARAHASCVFDVRVTGNLGFADTYRQTRRILSGATTTTVTDDRDPTKPGERMTFVATVSRRALGATRVPTGVVEFAVDGRPATEPMRLDAGGRARWRTANLAAGRHVISARYLPARGSSFLPSSSAGEEHTVE